MRLGIHACCRVEAEPENLEWVSLIPTFFGIPRPCDSCSSWAVGRKPHQISCESQKRKPSSPAGMLIRRVNQPHHSQPALTKRRLILGAPIHSLTRLMTTLPGVRHCSQDRKGIHQNALAAAHAPFCHMQGYGTDCRPPYKPRDAVCFLGCITRLP